MWIGHAAPVTPLTDIPGFEKGVFGGTLPAQIFQQFMTQAMNGKPVAFPTPAYVAGPKPAPVASTTPTPTPTTTSPTPTKTTASPKPTKTTVVADHDGADDRRPDDHHGCVDDQRCHRPAQAPPTTTAAPTDDGDRRSRCRGGLADDDGAGRVNGVPYRIVTDDSRWTPYALRASYAGGCPA